MELISLTGMLLMTAVATIAFFIGYLVSGKRVDNKKIGNELKASREELKKYRSEVTNHFQQTAHKVNALTEDFHHVYEHLAKGAQDLCSKDDAPQLMDELNKNNKMLGDETLKKPEEVEGKTAAGNDSDAEPEKDNAIADNETDTDAVEDKDINTEADKKS